MTGAVATGTVLALSDHRSALSVVAAAASAAGAARLSDLQRWRPPGPLFPVFAVAACSSIPLRGVGAVLTAAAVTVATAALALLLARAGPLVPSRVRLRTTPGPPTPPMPTPQPPTPIMPTPPMPQPPRPPPPPPPPDVVHPRHRRRVQAVRCVVAVMLPGFLALLVSGEHPYWAMVSAVVPMSAPTFRTQLTGRPGTGGVSANGGR